MYRKLVASALLVLACGCGGGGGSGGGGEPPPGSDPIAVGPLGAGVLLRTQHASDGAGNVHVAVDDRSIRFLLRSVDSGAPLVRHAVDVVSDDDAATLLGLSPAHLPLLHDLGSGESEVSGASALTGLTVRMPSIFGRKTEGLYGATAVSKRHAELLLQDGFRLEVSGVDWQQATRVLSLRLVGWLKSRTTSTRNGYILALVPHKTSGGGEMMKVMAYRGDAALLASWFSDTYTDALGREQYTFSVYTIRDTEALIEPVVILPNLDGPLTPTSGTGTIQGLANQDDVPLEGVRVTAVALDIAGPVIAPVYSGPDGLYQISGLPDGEYVVMVEKDGYQARVRPGKIVDQAAGPTQYDPDIRPTLPALFKADTDILYLRPGQTTPVGLQIANLGSSESFEWTTRFPSGRTYEGAGLSLSATQGTVAPGEIQRIVVQAAPDAPPGYHTNLLEVNGTTAQIGIFVVLGGEQFDLRIDDASLDETTVRAGRDTRLSVRWSSTGGARPHGLLDIRLSKDSVIDANDALISQQQHGPYASAVSGAFGGPVKIPESTAPGQYYVGVRLDSTDLLEEPNESNNVRALPLTVTSSSGGGSASIGPFSVTAREVRDSGQPEIEVRWSRAPGATEYRVRRLPGGSSLTALSVPEVVRDWASASLGRIFIDKDVNPGQSCRYEVDAQSSASAVRTASSGAASASSGRRDESLITNGSFSAGADSWTVSGDFWAGVDPDLTSYASAPGYAAGGVDRAGNHIYNAQGSLAQRVFLPPALSNAELSLLYNISTEETAVRTSYDTMTVAARLVDGREIPLVTLSNLNATGGAYVRATARMDSLIGHDITLVFRCVTDESKRTIFRLDDVKIVADAPESEVVDYRCRWPIDGYVKARSGFSPEYANYGVDGFHTGTDIASKQYSDVVVPVARGKVVGIFRDHAEWGNTVHVAHGGGYASVYLHLATIAPGLYEGKPVDHETPLGNEGDTGKADGKHLHFALYHVQGEDMIGRMPQRTRGNMYHTDRAFEPGTRVFARDVIEKWPAVPGKQE